MKILIVDDSNTASDSLIQAIRAGGHDVRRVDAIKGGVATDRLRKGGCDLVLLACGPDDVGRREESRLLGVRGGDAGKSADSRQTVDLTPEITLGDLVSLDDVERAHVRRVISRTASLEEAARILGIDAATLYRKRKRWAVTMRTDIQKGA